MRGAGRRTDASRMCRESSVRRWSEDMRTCFRHTHGTRTANRQPKMRIPLEACWRPLQHRPQLRPRIASVLPVAGCQLPLHTHVRATPTSERGAADLRTRRTRWTGRGRTTGVVQHGLLDHGAVVASGTSELIGIVPPPALGARGPSAPRARRERGGKPQPRSTGSAPPNCAPASPPAPRASPGPTAQHAERSSRLRASGVAARISSCARRGTGPQSAAHPWASRSPLRFLARFETGRCACPGSTRCAFAVDNGETQHFRSRPPGVSRSSGAAGQVRGNVRPARAKPQARSPAGTDLKPNA